MHADVSLIRILAVDDHPLVREGIFWACRWSSDMSGSR